MLKPGSGALRTICYGPCQQYRTACRSGCLARAIPVETENRRNPRQDLDAFDHPPIKSGELLRTFFRRSYGRGRPERQNVVGAKTHIYVGKIPENYARQVPAAANRVSAREKLGKNESVSHGGAARRSLRCARPSFKRFIQVSNAPAWNAGAQPKSTPANIVRSPR